MNKDDLLALYLFSRLTGKRLYHRGNEKWELR